MGYVYAWEVHSYLQGEMGHETSYGISFLLRKFQLFKNNCEPDQGSMIDQNCTKTMKKMPTSMIWIC